MKRLVALPLLGFWALGAFADTFYFQFDNDPGPFILVTDPIIDPPVVGTGTFTFANHLADGTHPFLDIGSFSLSFSFPAIPATFTEADITSDLNEVLVVLSTSGGVRRLQFSDTGSGGGGDFGGSLDLVDGDVLTFEPSYIGTGLRLYQSTTYFGDYIATAPVPESGSTISLLSIAVLGLGVTQLRKVKT